MIKEIGIVGQGFVGGSINSFFKNKVETHTFDLNGKCTCSSLDELVKKSELIFVCLPTPMYEDGSCDLSIISNTIKSIKDIDPEKIVVIKSTVVPGTVQKLIDSYDENIIFNPEFLTEANAANDFEMQDRIILGGYGEALRKCEEFFAHYFQNSKIILCSPTEAELVKYVTNTFLTTKVAYANEIYNICKILEVDFNNLSTIFTLDKRLGESHWSVPGPDGKYGYGGSCFPKDINALIYFANSINVATPVLNTVWKRNIEIDRPEQDWKGLVGRAVSKKNDKS
tara:strand:+ start:1077 stop:1925 length:849 start_codon:yes stop_codon:yes gene_type:complete